MKVLIVYAHMEPKSFNAALLDTATTALKAQGHDVTLSDLYAQKFNPVISREDTTESVGADEHFSYMQQMGEAMRTGRQAEDIKAEQGKVLDADLLILQFPMQWFSMPAIMKGWWERVFLNNFAYNMERKELYDKALMVGKKVLLSVTTGATEEDFSPDGLHGNYFSTILAPIHTACRMVGLSVLQPHACHNVHGTSDEGRRDMLAQWRERLASAFDEPTAPVTSNI